MTDDIDSLTIMMNHALRHIRLGNTMIELDSVTGSTLPRKLLPFLKRKFPKEVERGRVSTSHVTVVFGLYREWEMKRRVIRQKRKRGQKTLSEFGKVME